MAFDIDTYTENSEGVGWEDLDFGSFDEQPLPEITLRTLRYMCNVEYHTVCYLRDLLVTPSHKERDVNAFMTMWNREEFWHGEALADVLGRHGITVDYDKLKASRLKLEWRDKLAPLRQSILGNIVGADYIAVHMSWGAANEWSAVAAYRRLAALEQHPALSPLLRRIAQQETKHVAFYATQARKRLEQSKLARKLTRLALAKAWEPVGSSISDPEDVKHVMGHLFGTEDGIAEIRRIDANIAKLPGMEGLTIVEDALRKRGIAA
ncbi:MAG: ferritin-like domain-containing protein [Propionicimonas sp.]